MSKHSFKSLSLLSITLLASSISLTVKPLARKDLNVDKLHTDQLHFPKDFLFGFAMSEQQNSGADNLPDSQWTRWEQTQWPDGTPHINDGMTSGVANDHWNRFQEDIDLMKADFNANTFRFSLAWDRIEPRPGEFNEEALQHYSDEVDACLRAGIKPMITLHHFAHPTWFEDMGGFENEENIRYFVRYSQKVFERLGDRVPFWCTINEPTIYVLQGYLPLDHGSVFPPGKGRGITKTVTAWPLAITVLRNLMQAHTETYQALKAMKNGNNAQIGLVHQYLKFESYSSYDPFEKFIGFRYNNFLVDAVIDFLKTGTFTCGIPGINRQTYTAPDGPRGDFVGLNYYSKVFVRIEPFKLKAGSVAAPGEVMTDLEFGSYPQGIYEALQHMATIGLPIYITENGIADNQVPDVRRVQWIRRYLKAISVALEDGVDVRGFFYWTFTDNFEWNRGWASEFGLYTRDRVLKQGSQIYADIVKAARNGDLEKHTEDYIQDQDAFRQQMLALNSGSSKTVKVLGSIAILTAAWLAYKATTAAGEVS